MATNEQLMNAAIQKAGVTDADLRKSENQNVLAALERKAGLHSKKTELIVDRTDGGKQVLKPQEMSTATLAAEAAKQARAEEEVTSFTRVFKARPDDGAVGFVTLVAERFGFAPVGQTTYGMFGEVIRPEIRDVIVGFDADGRSQTVQVPHGQMGFTVPLPTGQMQATLNIMATVDEDFGHAFAIGVEAPLKYQEAIKGLFLELDDYLLQHSIYRGKVLEGVGRVRGRTVSEPKFMNIWEKPDIKLFFEHEVDVMIDEAIYSILELTEENRASGVKIGSTVVLAGDNGTGKTETTIKAAKAAINARENWTVIFTKPGEVLNNVITFARSLKTPVMIVWEDFESIVDMTDPKVMKETLALLDGAGTKGAEVMNILTTNHLNEVSRSTLRAERIDDPIIIGLPDKEAVIGLISEMVPEARREGEYDWDKIWQLCEGFTLAWVTSGVKRATRSAVRRTGKKNPTLSSADIEHGLISMRGFHDLHLAATDRVETPQLEQALGALVDQRVEKTLQGHKVNLQSEGELVTLS